MPWLISWPETATTRFLAEAGVEKGIMQLIDMDRAVELYGKIGPARGGFGRIGGQYDCRWSRQLGGRTAYVGKVKDDQLGAIFAHDMQAQGAVYETALSASKDGRGRRPGRCIVLVTPDGERSMNTYLGVTEFLTPADIDIDRGCRWPRQSGSIWKATGSMAPTVRRSLCQGDYGDREGRGGQGFADPL